jgi:hypothetical protein
LDRQLNDGGALPRPQLGQQHSPTIRKLNGVVVGVPFLRVHLAEANELPGRLSAEERE